MMKEHPRELLGAYADGELEPGRTAEVARHLEACTECAREVAIIRSMGGAMRRMVAATPPRDVWDGVNRRLSRPAGWILLVAGVLVWLALAALEWYRHRELSLEWLSVTAFVIGLALLGASVAFEQYREWRETRYRDVQR